MPDLSTLRTPDVAAVLDAVRETGMSAHPRPGNGDYMDISPLVFAMAVKLGRNPVELQAEVDAYADALDAAAGV